MLSKKQDYKPLFFLFTCIKDGNDYVDKLFDSLLHQTKINFVHYIYEDGSSKPLGNKLVDYQNKVNKLSTPYEVIYDYNPVNKGLNKATQHCISKCKCQYFIWIDCDNWVDSHFFEELEKTYYKNKNAFLIRSVLYDSNNNEPRRFNCGSVEEAKKSHQLGLFVRRRYYYSFFAVNYAQYIKVNPNNVMLNIRNFYNDEQILLLCLISSDNIALSKKAIGYFLTRDNQESVHSVVSNQELKKYQLDLLNVVDSCLKTKLESIYKIKDLYDELNKSYTNNSKIALMHLKNIRKISKEHKIDLKLFYDSSLIKYRLRILYWKHRNR